MICRIGSGCGGRPASAGLRQGRRSAPGSRLACFSAQSFYNVPPGVKRTPVRKDCFVPEIASPWPPTRGETICLTPFYFYLCGPLPFADLDPLYARQKAKVPAGCTARFHLL